jgi:hypothetical protein
LHFTVSFFSRKIGFDCGAWSALRRGPHSGRRGCSDDCDHRNPDPDQRDASSPSLDRRDGGLLCGPGDRGSGCGFDDARRRFKRNKKRTGV